MSDKEEAEKFYDNYFNETGFGFAKTDDNFKDCERNMHISAMVQFSNQHNAKLKAENERLRELAQTLITKFVFPHQKEQEKLIQLQKEAETLLKNLEG